MPIILAGKKYRSYKHPILEYIFDTKTHGLNDLPDEIVFTYEDIRQAMTALDMGRDMQASISNFTIDLLRRASSHETRVPSSLWDKGYDLDRVPEREARQNIAGRLIRKELKAKEPWIVWPEIGEEDTIIIPNLVPDEVKPYLGKDEGALLSVMDYCDALSVALHGQQGTIMRVQHPKKWQPGEVDGLYFSNYEERAILYPVEAKALSTNDNVNLAQVQGMYKTIRSKITDVEVIPLAVQMTSDGMYLAAFETTDKELGNLIITKHLKIKIVPPIENWKKISRS